MNSSVDQQIKPLPVPSRRPVSLWRATLGSRKIVAAVRKGMVYLLLAAGSVLYAIPLVWMLSTSLKPTAQLFNDPPVWIPSPIEWRTYLRLFQEMPITYWTVNTLMVVIFGILGQVLSSSLAAFGFSRVHFKGRELVFGLVLSTMMLPSWVTVIPTYKVFMTLGWVRTFKPLIVPSFFGSAFYIFLMRQFFLTLPRELDEAAEIDGCGLFGLYWRILLPLVKPALATVAVFSFLHDWNDFFRPLIYLSSYDLRKLTLALGLATLDNEYGTQQQLIMAGAVYSLIPVLVVFFLGQKYFVQGIALTGRTGT